MKRLSVLIFMVTSIAAADSLEFLGGGLTEHFGDNMDGRYRHKIGDSGRLIDNPLVGVGYEVEDEASYRGLLVFGGQNSVARPMVGATGAVGRKFCDQHVYVGVVAGAYGQSDSQYVSAGIKPFKLTNIDDVDVVPVVGGQAALKVSLSERFYLKVQETITPILMNTAVAVGVAW